ncbi:MAG: NAD(P)-dependent oxidoreductase [Pseudomonadota bacterium]
MSQVAGAQLLVTGASGFLGRTIVVRAQAHGLTSFAATRAEVDQSDPKALARLIDQVSPTYAIDAAGILPGRGNVSDNVVLTQSWLDALALVGHVPRLVLTGSAAVYGAGSAANRATREDDPMQPISDYGRAKLKALQLGRAACSSGDLDVQTGIVFNLIGEGQPAHLVPQVFIRRAMEDPHAVQNVARTETVRDFTDVEDAADALIAMAMRGRKGDVFNIATGQPARIRDVLDSLEGMIGLRWQAKAAPAEKNEIDVCYGDPARLMSRTGWRPRYDLDAALTRAIEVAQASRAGERGV